MLAAHMFVFYFGIIADITPPVALAAYAGASIARSDPMKTGITASRLGIAAFIVPYVFALSPQILFIDPAITVTDPAFYSTFPSLLSMIQVTISAFIGASAIAVALTGFINGNLSWLERIVILGSGLMLIIPETITDVVGISVIVIIFIQHKVRVDRAERLIHT